MSQNMGLYILKPGVFATVQDLGRYGYQSYGVPVSGAMDLPAARIANLLVGNAEDKAVLEITMTGTEFIALTPLLLAICGGSLQAWMDGQTLPQWRPVVIPEGSTVRFKAPLPSPLSGCRAYVAFGGGLDVLSVMGSRSTYTRAELGGIHGRSLRAGDELLTEVMEDNSLLSAMLEESQHSLVTVPWSVNADFLYPFRRTEGSEKAAFIRVMKGTHYDLMDEDSKKLFTEQRYQVDTTSDRMGYRLKGLHRRLIFGDSKELLSEGVVHGTIQLPPSGEPVLLLSDRQTTGGYPRIAQVASADLPQVAQLKPGEYINFQYISVEEAEDLLLQQEKQMRQIRSALRLKWK
ncbi:biotin-dependent carboxyltransferase family protein [Paenibacillus sp. Marseille-Q4541]|uniref:5-oxoprolinase subunit C family protein n=1 Tax=Paenibacillus sp. Marseille-Q4541 TaxID=2831522 RepID=UPI00201978C1|nr:biotin-dependent carboxyltransferase family protein [Paenibacillus sp. Marseille-Q4541]